ncbi:carbohydrate porin [Curvibacter sp. APW13]|uniref:carbohydrate porin n=1 Tax=Curvibacter sp. APW13 TaxID=3077236 RepID=UPI0028DF3F4D|nr:carbohydrate porin [Curvibacter sp. APW13]MDT8992952.1 carbohydrate porin [Curvibacter sp. APW13]
MTFAVRASTAAVLCLCGSAFAAPAIDANIELDNTSRDGTYVAAADKGLTQSGRLELNVANKAGADAFVAGRATFLSKKDGTVATDDMWIQLGNASTDVKLGRFEAADLFPLAGDTLVNHAGTVYGANTLRGRKASDVFHAATTFNLGSGLAFELGLISTTTTNLSGATARGLRPVLSYTSGPLAAKLGLEQGEYNSGNKVSGFGLTVGYDFGAFKLTGNYAQGKQDATIDDTQSAYALTVAVGGLSVGAISAKNDATGGDTRVQTGYVSYSMPLFGIKGATITPAVSVSKAADSVANTNKEETAFRVRLHYDF